eukprot:jgi/Ulvmu1/192/UM001_0196.1
MSSSRYQHQFKIPDEFPALLKDFTREILRAQPGNLFTFGAQYFAEKRNAGLSGKTGKSVVDGPAEDSDDSTDTPIDNAAKAHDYQRLSEAVYECFKQADTNGDGTLDRQEFAKALKNSRLGLSQTIIDRVLAEADDNADGVIQYNEFVPILMDVIAVDDSAKAAAKDAQALVDGVRENMHEFLLYGIPKQELEGIMARVFREADKDNSGTLDKNEFKLCLQTAELSLTRKDINLLMAKVDVDGDGCIDYREFVPICFGILVERFADQVMSSSVLSSTDGIKVAILQNFKELDVDGRGELSVRKVRQALNKFSEQIVPLTVYQIHTIVSVAPLDKLGTVKYTQMVPIVAQTVKAIIDLQHMKQRFYVIQQLSESNLLKELAEADPSIFRQQLRQAFENADKDGSGTLTGRQVSNVLRGLASTTGNSLRLDPAVWQSMLAVVDADENGQVEWDELVQFMCDVFKHIERDKVVRQAMQQSEAGAVEAHAGGSMDGPEGTDASQAAPPHDEQAQVAVGAAQSLSDRSNEPVVAEAPNLCT